MPITPPDPGLPCPADPSGSAAVWSLLRVWALALALSTALVAAGERWPQPLTPDGRWVWALVLGLPLLMGLWLWSRWGSARGAGNPDRGESVN
ncbi:MAG: hypothetical protein K0U63_04255 [Cyanobacteria bacterium]|jgi:hypothetical protein|nr:hypothetical protein [Cyanobacteriota bacterium]